jgi:hypothetical protein
MVADQNELGIEFVESIPSELEQWKLYVCIRFRTTAHLCMCGCGNKVVHPLRPNRWSLTYDGSSISLAPSIANDGLPCKSHYWIRRSRVDWYQPLTPRQADRARARDAGLYDQDPRDLLPSQPQRTTRRPKRAGWKSIFKREVDR